MNGSGGAGSRPRLLLTASTYPRWSDDPEPGFVHELARRLTSRFDVTVLAPHAPGARERECMDGVDVVRFRYAPARWETLVQGGGIGTNLRRYPLLWLLVPLYGLMHSWSLARCIRAMRPDVIHVHWIIPQGACLQALRALGMTIPPVLLTSHGADLFSFRGRFAIRLKRWALRGVEHVTVVSEAMRAPVAALGIEKERIRVEPMGVDLDVRFTPSAAGPVSDEVLFVGRMVEKKGLAQLIEAMPRVLAMRPRTRLRIAGFGPEEARCRELVAQLRLEESVAFLGPVAQRDLPALYRSASLLVAPFVEASSGDQEGLGLVVLEAIGCGCPVLVGRVQATPDLVSLTDGAVATVDALDLGALADAIVANLRDPDVARAQALRARRALAARMGWGAVALRYGELLESLVGRAD